MDEKPYKYENLPIPTYEEATSSRPTSSQSRIGPQEASDDAERQGLLGRAAVNTTASRRSNYEPPTVQSERSSLDSLDGLEAASDDGAVRREMEEFEMGNPDSDNGSHRSLLTYRFKRLTSFTSSFPSLRLPSFPRVPSIPWPQIDWASIDANKIVIIGRLFGVALIMGLVYLLVASDLLVIGRGQTRLYDPEVIKNHVQGQLMDPTHIGMHLQHITKYPHLAGTEGNYVLGEYIAEIFKGSMLEDVNMERFDVYLNYPRKDGRRVAIVEPEDKKWEAQLEEDHEQTLVFHGSSKSGDVTGRLVYANYGSPEDFVKLKEMDISVKDAIVLVRYYGTEDDRGLKVQFAADAGAIGCIEFSDPINEGAPDVGRFPDGRALPFDGVQRGAVSLQSYVIGDLLSPGWASTPGDKRRLKPEESRGLVQIPSLPISWRDAQHLLKALQGHGKKMEGDWAGWPDTEYWTGDQNSPKVNLKNLQDEEIYQPIYNVLGKITGIDQPQKKIIVGNHRDAWCVGGADPGSGTAVMLHMIRIFGELRSARWRPLRTIEFASWDGEEYNMIGSTEHVENREDELRRNGVVYLNVDMAAYGQDFKVAASPIFNGPLRRAMGRVADPASNKTIKDIWDEKNSRITPPGAGSDFVAFQDIVGTSVIDMGFEGPQYPYHSCYDNFEWMEKFGDPRWEYSAAIAQMWALLILDFADNPLLPFDLKHYISSFDEFVNDLERDIRKFTKEGHPLGADLMTTPTGQSLNFLPLRNAIDSIRSAVREVEEFDERWMNAVYSSGGFESSLITVKREDRNNRVANFETHLLDMSEGGGLVNRTQFKHVIFAPVLNSGYGGETFPSIRQWLPSQDWTKMQQEIDKVAGIMENAATQLII